MKKDEAPNISGVYKIQYKDKIYIGSTINLKRRKSGHFNRLRRSCHENQILQNYYNKYKAKHFTFSPIIYCSREYLLKLEQLFIDKLDPFFNISPSADSTYGYKHKDEDKDRMSEIKKRQYEEGLEPHNKGKSLDKSVKNKISNTLKEYYKNHKHPFKGKTHTEEAKKKIIEASHRRKGTHNKSPLGYLLKLDKKGNKLKVYCSTGEAAKEVQLNGTLKTTRTKILEAAKSKNKTAYGFKWRFVQNLDQIKLDELLEGLSTYVEVNQQPS